MHVCALRLQAGRQGNVCSKAPGCKLSATATEYCTILLIYSIVYQSHACHTIVHPSKIQSIRFFSLSELPTQPDRGTGIWDGTTTILLELFQINLKAHMNMRSGGGVQTYLAPLNISVIPNKSQRLMCVWESGGGVQTFNSTLLGEVEEVIWISYISNP